jgi:hypothetical protein
MKQTILGLRLSRRAIGAVSLTHDNLTMTEGRHLMSARLHAIPAALRFIARMLEQSGATVVALDTPQTLEGTTTNELLNGIRQLLSSRQVRVLLTNKVDILRAYGVRPVHTRNHVRDIVNGFWPQLGRVTGRVQPYAADAAAAALYAECYLVLSPQPT